MQPHSAKWQQLNSGLVGYQSFKIKLDIKNKKRKKGKTKIQLPSINQEVDHKIPSSSW